MNKGIFCFLLWALIFSLALPLSMTSHATSQNADDTAFVHARLENVERKAAIARAAEMNKTAREAFAKNKKEPSAAEFSEKGLQGSEALAEGTQEGSASLKLKPQNLSEVMFNAATGMVGLPGLAGNQEAPYNPNAQAANSNNHGRQATAGYAAHGRGMDSMNDDYGVSDDPVAGYNGPYEEDAYPNKKKGHSYANGAIGFLHNSPSYFMQHGLNYGVGKLNSAAEGLFFGFMKSPYGGANARFNFMLDLDGRLNGEGDVLLPFYDGKYSTVFTQLGLRSMSGIGNGGKDGRGADRWIGNFGLGQRWYPMAVNDGTGDDAGNVMLGYNVFFDNDFTRSHQRGGVGVEIQYDWLHLASNYYTPLSNWKGSYDFDRRFVEERPAKGWDVRAKGYLPFYRNVAVTGAYTKWYGEHVGMYSSRDLEKNPRVWSYGVEYTPIPLFSGYINQRHTERRNSDTEFGFRITYKFGMPWKHQVRHDKVAEMRTVGHSRHEFVDRENKIILEYKEKERFHIEYLGLVEKNIFKFKVLNGFGKPMSKQEVLAAINGNATLAETRMLTDQNGEFIVRVGNVTTTPLVLTVTVKKDSKSIVLHDATLDGKLLAAKANILNTESTLLTLSDLPPGATVAWSVQSGPGSLSGAQTTTNASGIATATLAGNATGSGAITVQAIINGITHHVTVTINPTGTLITADATILNNGATALTLSSNQPGATVAWSVLSGPGTLSAAQTSTNVSGTATATLTGNATGTGAITVQATINGTNHTVAVNISPTGGLVAATATILNNGSTVLTLSSNQPGATVAWSVLSGPGALSGTQTPTDASGTATATLTGNATGSGPITVQATINGTNHTVAVNISPTGGLAAATATILNNGATVLTLSSNQPGATVAWSVLSGPGALSGAQITTNVSGTATATLTGNATGSGAITVQAIINGVTHTVNVTINSTSGLAVATATILNNGSTVLTLSSNQPGATVTWSVLSGPGALSGAQSTTNASGIATATLTGNATGNGAITVQATINGTNHTVVATIGPTGGLATATATILNNGATVLTLSSNQPGATVAWSVLSGPGALSGAQITTNASGIATATLTGNATGNGPITVQATINGINHTVAVNISPTGGLATATATILNNGATALTLSSNQPGATVAWSVLSGPGTLSAAQTSTNVSGTATATLTGNATGSGPITVQAIINGVTHTVNVTISPTGTLAATHATILNSGSTTLTLASNQPGETVAWSVLSGSGALSGAQTPTDTSGTATATLTGNATGNGPITVQALVNGNTYTTSVSIPALLTLEQDVPSQTFPSSITRTGVSFTLHMNGVPLSAGTVVSLGYTGTGSFSSPSTSATVASGGKITLNLTGNTVGNVTLTATVGSSSASCTLAVMNAYKIEIDSFTNGASFSTSSRASVTAIVKNDDAPISNVPVTWSIVSANNSTNPAVTSAYATKKTGLTWGTNPTALTGPNPSELSSTNANTTATDGKASISLTDIVGQRSVVLKAEVTLGGSTLSVQQTVSFGAGPLQSFRVPSGSVGYAAWANAATIASSTSFPAAEMCGGSGNPSWGAGDYSAMTNLPSYAQFQALHSNGYGAHYAAGWPSPFISSGNEDAYHTGTILFSSGSYSPQVAYIPPGSAANSFPSAPNYSLNVVCRN